MKKAICDLCGEDALPDLRAFVEMPCVEPYTATGNFGIEKRQCKVVVKAVFSFQDHQTGFGGPPDLCLNCRNTLLKHLSVLAS